MKSDKFLEELNYIKNEDIKKDAIVLLNLLPDYFYTMPASTSGKYHPSYALGDAGLLRHTKAAVKIAVSLLENLSVGSGYTSHEKDLLILALLMHDGLKKGINNEYHTRFDHPIVASDFIKENKDKLSLTSDDIKLVTECIASHMGQWNCDKFSSFELPVPENKYQRFVHMCDYLASRKFLEVPFDENNNIIN